MKDQKADFTTENSLGDADAVVTSTEWEEETENFGAVVSAKIDASGKLVITATYLKDPAGRSGGRADMVTVASQIPSRYMVGVLSVTAMVTPEPSAARISVFFVAAFTHTLAVPSSPTAMYVFSPERPKGGFHNRKLSG